MYLCDAVNKIYMCYTIRVFILPISEPYTRLMPDVNTELADKVTFWCDKLRAIEIEPITYGTIITDPQGLGKNCKIPQFLRRRVKGKERTYFGQLRSHILLHIDYPPCTITAQCMYVYLLTALCITKNNILSFK